MDTPNVGDEVEFDGHIVTIESFTGQETHSVQNAVAAAAAARAGLTPSPSVIQHAPMAPQLPPPTSTLNELSVGSNNNDYRSARKKLRTLSSNNAPSRPRNNFVPPQQYMTPFLHEQQQVASAISDDLPQLQQDPLVQQQPLKQPRVQREIVEKPINSSITINNDSTVEEETQVQLATRIQQTGLNDSNNNNGTSGYHNETNHIDIIEDSNISAFPGSSKSTSNNSNTLGSTINVRQEEVSSIEQQNNDNNNDLFNRFSFNENNSARAPSMKRIGKRVVLSQQQHEQQALINDSRNDIMEVDSNVSATNTASTATMTTATTTFIDPAINNNNRSSTLSPSQKIQTQPSPPPPPPQRRVRVGLSKRTNNALHNDDTINYDISSSSSRSATVNNGYHDINSNSNSGNNNEQTITRYIIVVLIVI